MSIISSKARGITSRWPERGVPPQARLHALLASVRRRTHPGARAHVKVHVHPLAFTTHEVARTVPKADPSLRQSDVRRTSACAAAQLHVSRAPARAHRARGRFASPEGESEPTQILMCAAQVASRPHTSALTVQEPVMTLAQAHARLREENLVRKKPYGAYLERVSPRRRGNANALSP